MPGNPLAQTGESSRRRQARRPDDLANFPEMTLGRWANHGTIGGN